MADGDTSSSPTFNSRQHQMFPVLTREEIERISRFGTRSALRARQLPVRCRRARPRHVRRARRATSAISQRDGLGRVVPIVHAGAGPVPRRGRPAVGPARAGRRPCATTTSRCCWCRPAAAARADHRRGRSRRAHRARADPAPRRADRGRRERPGADRPSRSRRRAAAAELPAPQRPCRTTCSTPTHDADAAALVEQYGAAVGDVLAVCPERLGAAATRPRRRSRAASAWSTPASATSCSTSPSSAPARPASRPRSTPHRRACSVVVLDCRAYGGQAGRQRAHRELPGLSDRHLGRRRWPAAPSCRRRSSAPRC